MQVHEAELYWDDYLSSWVAELEVPGQWTTWVGRGPCMGAAMDDLERAITDTWG